MSENKIYEFENGEWAWSPQNGFDEVKKVTPHCEDTAKLKHGNFYYSLDGFRNLSDKYPTLLNEKEAEKLGYSRIKIKDTRGIQAWINVFKGNHQVLYLRKEEADEPSNAEGRIACVVVDAEYEVME